MKLNNIRCQNFFSHKDTNLAFEDGCSPVLVTGDNGAGKSSAVSEALTFAIFGKIRVDNVDDIMRDNQDEMSVTIEFEMNGQDILINRRKKRGKPQKVSMTIDGTSVSELTSETQVRIDKLFGLSYDSFRSSVILRQEDADFFVQQKPDDRKKIIAEILDLNAYEKLEKVAKERRQEIKAAIKAEQSILESLEFENVDELESDLQQVNEYLAKYPNKISKAQAALDSITAQNTRIKEDLARYQKALENKKNLEAKINNYVAEQKRKKAELAELEDIGADVTKEIAAVQTNIEKAEQDIEDLTDKVKLLEAQYTAIIQKTVNEYRETEIEPVRQKIAILQSSLEEKTNNLQKAKKAGLKCEACDRPFEDAKDREQYIKGIEKAITEIQTLGEKESDNLQKLLANLKVIKTGDFPDAQSIRTELKEKEENLDSSSLNLKKLRTLLSTHQEQRRKYELAQSRKVSLNEAIAALLETITDLREQQDNTNVIPPSGTDSLLDESAPRAKVNELREAEKDGLKIKSQLEQRIETGTKANQRHQTITSGLNSKIKRLGLLEKLCVAFSRKGVPAAIIETVLPEIQETANKYLDRMSEGNLSIRFNTLATLKNGEQRETLEIEVFDGQNWRIFESFSGGEKFRVSLSIRLSLSHILSIRAGIDLELLILDEPASPLDPVGREVFVSTIKSLSTHFSRIILISHLQDLQEEFEYRINLTKSESATKVL